MIYEPKIKTVNSIPQRSTGIPMDNSFQVWRYQAGEFISENGITVSASLLCLSDVDVLHGVVLQPCAVFWNANRGTWALLPAHHPLAITAVEIRRKGKQRVKAVAGRMYRLKRVSTEPVEYYGQWSVLPLPTSILAHDRYTIPEVNTRHVYRDLRDKNIRATTNFTAIEEMGEFPLPHMDRLTIADYGPCMLGGEISDVKVEVLPSPTSSSVTGTGKDYSVVLRSPWWTDEHYGVNFTPTGWRATHQWAIPYPDYYRVFLTGMVDGKPFRHEVK